MKEREAIIFFDGVCNLCNASIQFIIRKDKKAYFSFAPLQGKKAQEILPAHLSSKNMMSSILLLKDGELYHRSAAVLEICRHLQLPLPLLYGFIIVPTFIRNWVYNAVARNRYKWFGKRNECMVPTKEITERFLS